MNLGVALTGGNGKRRENDFYETPVEATIALVHAVRQFMGPTIHEPACGRGKLARVLEAEGFDVIGTDLMDRGYGHGGIDFLTNPLLADTVITNPPFKHAAAFIECALRQKPRFLALLLKATFWHADERYELYSQNIPQLTMPLTWRLDFTDQKRPTMECAWFVWCPEIEPSPPIPLRRPKTWGIFA